MFLFPVHRSLLGGGGTRGRWDRNLKNDQQMALPHWRLRKFGGLSWRKGQTGGKSNVSLKKKKKKKNQDFEKRLEEVSNNAAKKEFCWERAGASLPLSAAPHRPCCSGCPGDRHLGFRTSVLSFCCHVHPRPAAHRPEMGRRRLPPTAPPPPRADQPEATKPPFLTKQGPWK